MSELAFWINSTKKRPGWWPQPTDRIHADDMQPGMAMMSTTTYGVSLLRIDQKIPNPDWDGERWELHPSYVGDKYLFDLTLVAVLEDPKTRNKDWCLAVTDAETVKGARFGVMYAENHVYAADYDGIGGPTDAKSSAKKRRNYLKTAAKRKKKRAEETFQAWAEGVAQRVQVGAVSDADLEMNYRDRGLRWYVENDTPYSEAAAELLSTIHALPVVSENDYLSKVLAARGIKETRRKEVKPSASVCEYQLENGHRCRNKVTAGRAKCSAGHYANRS